MWINPETLQRFTLHGEIRAAFSNVSFPAGMSEQDIESVGLAPVVAQPVPGFNPITHNVLELAPVFDNGQWLQQWEVYELPAESATANLAAARAARWEEIKAERTRRKEGGVLVAGKWFHTDDPSRIQWLGLVALGAGVPAQPWKTMDNTTIPLTPSLVQQVFIGLITKEQTIFNHAETLRAAVFASSNPAAVDIQAGWPAVYGGAQ